MQEEDKKMLNSIRAEMFKQQIEALKGRKDKDDDNDDI